jgi:hypothetical protein
MKIHSLRRALASLVMCCVLGLSAASMPTAHAADSAADTPFITLTFDRIGYEWWGRPYFIDDPNRKNCDADDSKRNLMMSIGVSVKNNGYYGMMPDTWHFVFTRNTGQPAAWCFYRIKGTNSEPNITIYPGETVSFAVQVFMEPSERIRSAYIIDKRNGRSNTINIARTLPIPELK